jgi:hypothetical protein
MRAWSKDIKHNPRARSRIALTLCRRLVQSFACRTAYVCGANNLTSVAVMLHFASPSEMYLNLPHLQHTMENAITNGIANAKLTMSTGRGHMAACVICQSCNELFVISRSLYSHI